MRKSRSLVGEIVLLRIHDDPLIERPLLVVADKNSVLSGELFLDWEEDCQAEWIQKNMFYRPSRELRTTTVYKIPSGSGLGQWRKR